MSPRVRESVSHCEEIELTEPDLLTIDGERRVGAPSGSLSFRGCEKRFLLERRLASLSVSYLRHY